MKRICDKCNYLHVSMCGTVETCVMTNYTKKLTNKYTEQILNGNEMICEGYKKIV